MKHTWLTLAFAGTVLTVSLAQAADFTVTGTDGGADGTLAQAQFANGFGCTGGNVSPQISWKNAPEGTKSFAIRASNGPFPTISLLGVRGSETPKWNCGRLRM